MSNNIRRQPFALADDLVALRERVAQLEGMLTTIIQSQPGHSSNGYMLSPHLTQLRPAPVATSPTFSSLSRMTPAGEDEANVAAALQTLRGTGLPIDMASAQVQAGVSPVAVLDFHELTKRHIGHRHLRAG